MFVDNWLGIRVFAVETTSILHCLWIYVSFRVKTAMFVWGGLIFQSTLFFITDSVLLTSFNWKHKDKIREMLSSKYFLENFSRSELLADCKMFMETILSII